MKLTTIPPLLLLSIASASPLPAVQRCGSQTYAANEYICYAELSFLLCPVGAGLPCPRSDSTALFDCYSPAQYECNNATLVPIPGASPTAPASATPVVVSCAPSPSPSPAMSSASAVPSSAVVPVSSAIVPVSSAMSSAVVSFADPISSAIVPVPSAMSSAVVSSAAVLPSPGPESAEAVAVPVSSAMSSAVVPSAVVLPSESADALASSMAEADHD